MPRAWSIEQFFQPQSSQDVNNLVDLVSHQRQNGNFANGTEHFGNRLDFCRGDVVLSNSHQYVAVKMVEVDQ